MQQQQQLEESLIVGLNKNSSSSSATHQFKRRGVKFILNINTSTALILAMVSSLPSAGPCTCEYSYCEGNLKCPTVKTNMFIGMYVSTYYDWRCQYDREGEDEKCINNGVLQIFGKCDKRKEKFCNNNS